MNLERCTTKWGKDLTYANMWTDKSRNNGTVGEVKIINTVARCISNAVKFAPFVVPVLLGNSIL